MKTYSVGIDIGSSAAKVVVLEDNKVKKTILK
jgi:activator of 2-hydroxyglutaryl-CoA dehydratase